MITPEQIARELANAAMGSGYNNVPAPSIASTDTGRAQPLRVSLGLATFTVTDTDGGVWLVSVRPAIRVHVTDGGDEIRTALPGEPGLPS